jgi:hypothetical protein
MSRQIIALVALALLIVVTFPNAASAQQRIGGTTPLCAEGETRSCTLGPPAVCSCRPVVRTKPIIGSASKNPSGAASKAKN